MRSIFKAALCASLAVSLSTGLAGPARAARADVPPETNQASPSAAPTQSVPPLAAPADGELPSQQPQAEPTVSTETTPGEPQLDPGASPELEGQPAQQTPSPAADLGDQPAGENAEPEASPSAASQVPLTMEDAASTPESEATPHPDQAGDLWYPGEPGQTLQPRLLGDAQVVRDPRSPVGALKIYDNAGRKFNLCTGTLIAGPRGGGNSKWVLTARQCFVNPGDANALNPRLVVSPGRVSFHLDHQAGDTGVKAKNIYLDERKDLALVELVRVVDGRMPLGVSATALRAGASFSSLGYGSPHPDPWQGISRRLTTKRKVATQDPAQGTCLGDAFGGFGDHYNITGDLGGPAIDATGKLVGVFTKSKLNIAVNPRGERYWIGTAETAASKWVSDSAIRRFLEKHNSKTGFGYRGSWVDDLTCEKGRKPETAVVLTTSDKDANWSVSVNNGRFQYHHPQGAANRVAKVGGPVAFNLYVCYLGFGYGCTVEQTVLVPSGWKVQDGLAPGSRLFAAPNKGWIGVANQTLWGRNLADISQRPYQPQSTPPKKPQRLQGWTRVDTAADVFAAQPVRGTAVLVSGASFPDAVVAAPVAASYGTGVLLTMPGEKLERTVRVYLYQYGVKRVIIVGSTGAVSAAKERELVSAGISVTRLGGSDRYETATKVAQHLRARGANEWVFLADGSGFADALAAGAAAGSRNGYVLLTRTHSTPQGPVDSSPAAVRSLHKGRSGTVAVGGRAVAASRNWGSVTGVVGSDRYETAAILAWGFGGYDTVVGASGVDFPDALAASALAANKRGTLLLLPKAGRSGAAMMVRSQYRPRQVYVVGGQRTVPEAIAEAHLYPKWDL